MCLVEDLVSSLEKLFYFNMLARNSLSSIVNYLLRKIGFQIIRVNTLERLIVAEKKCGEFFKNNHLENDDAKDVGRVLESRLAALESQMGQSIQDLIRYAMKAHWRTVDMIDRISGKDKPDICPLCGCQPNADEFRERVSDCIFWGGHLIRYECPNCDVIFGPQKMFDLDSEMLDLDYRNLYRVYSEGNSTDSIIRTFYLLNPSKSGVYLDYGCGGHWSEAINILRSEGWNVYGFEPNVKNSSEYVFSKWDELIDKKFDGIISHNVLEHLFDPVETTKKLGAMLTNAGCLIHATPCFEYRYEFTHYHVFFFTGRSADILARKSRMRIVDWVRDEQYIACVLKKQFNRSD